MSYSFSVTGANKAEVLERIGQQFDTVVQQQSAHAHDRDAAEDAVEAIIDKLSDPTGGQTINVTVYGSLSQSNGDDAAKRRTTSVSLNVSANVV